MKSNKMAFKGRRGLTFKTWRRASLRVRKGRACCHERESRKSQRDFISANPKAISLISILSKLGEGRLAGSSTSYDLVQHSLCDGEHRGARYLLEP